jgi:hypothetical protein
VRDNIRALRAALQAGVAITAQRDSARKANTGLVIAIERNMEDHAHSEEPSATPARAKRRQQRQGPGAVQQTCARMLLRTRPVKIAQRGGRIEAARV